MPTVLREGPFSVRIYVGEREHGPPHVHIYLGSARATIWLGDSPSIPTLRENKGLTAHELRKAKAVVLRNADFLRAIWRRFHD